ncbi:DUF6597 domain-containing transcriptional factor [Streptomyces sp. NPDC051561]|uniref:AraC family transcriptional regulator n=1 Tax=Streptomyces sp. NPDC051561 TaxID=3365658 RepID=UPI00379A5361
MAAPRRDTRGIVDAAGLMARVRFRRHEPAPELRPFLEHYWFIDWDLPEPYASHLVPHPSVNVVFQRDAGRPCSGEVAGVGRGMFTRKLEGAGRVCGVQFKPGGFGPFVPGSAVSEWTGRQVPLAEVFPGLDGEGDPSGDVLDPPDEHARVAALDAFLLALGPRPDPGAELAMALADRIRHDRTIRRAGDLARDEGMSLRTLQRLFAGRIGVGPKWVILRYRMLEALEYAESATAVDVDAEAHVDWARLAADLGYADQAHLVRDFTATLGVPPTAYASGRRTR